MGNANNESARGFAWSFLERIGSSGIGLIISIILARMIAPDAYGIIAAANIFTSIATVFVTGGFGSAIIQKKNADDLDYSSMFYFNILFSVVIYAVIFFAAPWLIRFLNKKSFDYDLLVLVVRIIGIGVVFSSFNSFYRSLMMRNLQFKKIFFVTLFGMIASATIGVVMAFKGYGVWALITQNVVSYVSNAVLFVVFSKWKPKRCFSIERLRPMVSYGGKLMLSSLLTTVYSDINSIVIGNRYDSESLAYYQKGISYPKLIVQNILAAMNTVLFPVMVTLNNSEEHKGYIKRFNRTSSFIVMPLMLGLAAVGNTFIPFLLTNKWQPAAVFLQIACIDYALQPIGISNLQYLKAVGKAGLYLKLDVIKKVFGCLLIVVAVFWGNAVIWLAIANLVGTVIANIITIIPQKKLINYSLGEQIKDVLPMVMISTSMAAIVCALGRVLPFAMYINLTIQVLIGIAYYVAVSFMFKLPEAGIVKQYMISLLLKKEKRMGKR